MKTLKTGPFVSFFLQEYKKYNRDLEKTLTDVANYGFEFFTLNLSYPLMEKYTARQLKHIIKDLDLELACHGPYELFLGSVQEITRQAMVKICKSCLKYADILDAVYMNFHIFEAQYFWLPLKKLNKKLLLSHLDRSWIYVIFH